MKPIIYCGLLQMLVSCGVTAHAEPRVVDAALAQNTIVTSPPPVDNTLRRINPNSRQGSTSSAPPVRGATTLPAHPVPTLENGQIRNGYPRPTTPPATLKPTAPSLQRQNAR